MEEFISSDTNVWIDFDAINAIGLPFKLSCTFLMWEEAVDNEIRSPEGLRQKLIEYGLLPVQITADEYWLADELGDKYAGISAYDAVALAIAKSRDIVLMTGDKRLRKAAHDVGVMITGTIGVLDRLLSESLIDAGQYHTCIQTLIEINGGIVRLPENELRARFGDERA